MTKEDLKKLIQEVYKEVASEPKAEKAKAEKPKSAPAAEKPAVKKVAKVVKAVAPKAEDPNKITKSFVKTIDKHGDKNKFAGDKGDADLFGKIKKILTPYVGRRLEESDLDKVMEEMECEECYEEGAKPDFKPDFLDLDKDGNENERMRDAAMDAKTRSKKLKEIIEKAKNI
jgi:hypothetical protein